MSRIKFYSTQEALEKLFKLLNKITPLTKAPEGRKPSKFQEIRMAAAKQYMLELKQVIEILGFNSNNKVRVMTEKQAKKRVHPDDLQNEIDGQYIKLATVWQFPISDPYILVSYTPIKDL